MPGGPGLHSASHLAHDPFAYRSKTECVMNESQSPEPQKTWLDRAAEDLLGDRLPKHFGTGWYSGLLGLFLSVGSFLAVLVFHFPQWLTLSETAPRYPVETMRALLALAIMGGYLFSAINVILRPSKRLGLTGLVFCMAAVLGGGSAVEVGGAMRSFGWASTGSF